MILGKSEMKNYWQLTQRGQARRLRKLVDKALLNYDLEIRSIRLVTKAFNGIFRLDATDGQKYALRVALPSNGHSVEHITSEMQFLNALSQAEDFSTPIPIPTKSGAWVTTVSDDGVPEARHCVICSWVDGVDLIKHISPPNWEKFGRLCARLHQVAATFRPPATFSIYTYDKIFPFEGEFILLDDKNRKFLTAEEFELLKMAVDKVQAEIEQLHSNKSAIRVTHGDLHHWNVQIARGKLGLIDFEDLIWAHPIQDIGTTLFYNRFAENYEALFAAFKRGYTTIAPFPETYEGQVETHILARRLCVLNDAFTFGEAYLQNSPDMIPLTIRQIREVCFPKATHYDW
jgi:Ser/Thr protein kinase RdoA (MazF antagonist)